MLGVLFFETVSYASIKYLIDDAAIYIAYYQSEHKSCNHSISYQQLQNVDPIFLQNYFYSLLKSFWEQFSLKIRAKDGSLLLASLATMSISYDDCEGCGSQVKFSVSGCSQRR